MRRRSSADAIEDGSLKGPSSMAMRWPGSSLKDRSAVLMVDGGTSGADEPDRAGKTVGWSCGLLRLCSRIASVLDTSYQTQPAARSTGPLERRGLDCAVTTCTARQRAGERACGSRCAQIFSMTSESRLPATNFAYQVTDGSDRQLMADRRPPPRRGERRLTLRCCRSAGTAERQRGVVGPPTHSGLDKLGIRTGWPQC